MAVELVDIRTSTRGQNSRILTYKGIGRVTPFDRDEKGEPIPETELKSKSDSVDVSGIVTSFKDAVELCNGDMQLALDDFANGYNLRQRELILEEQDEFLGLLDAFDWAKIAANAKVKDEVTEKKDKDGNVISTRKVDAIETVKGQFKRTVRTMAKQSGMEIKDVVEFLSGKMPKAEPVAA